MVFWDALLQLQVNINEKIQIFKWHLLAPIQQGDHFYYIFSKNDNSFKILNMQLLKSGIKLGLASASGRL